MTIPHVLWQSRTLRRPHRDKGPRLRMASLTLLRTKYWQQSSSAVSGLTAAASEDPASPCSFNNNNIIIVSLSNQPQCLLVSIDCAMLACPGPEAGSRPSGPDRQATALIADRPPHVSSTSLIMCLHHNLDNTAVVITHRWR